MMNNFILGPTVIDLEMFFFTFIFQYGSVKYQTSRVRGATESCGVFFVCFFYCKRPFPHLYFSKNIQYRFPKF